LEAGCFGSTFKMNKHHVFKVTRLHCRDYRRIKTNRELCEKSGLRTFNSMRLLGDAIMLHRLCRNPQNTDLTVRLKQQSFFMNRIPEKIFFFDNSTKRIGRHSFINRAKMIAETNPFPWPDFSFHVFKTRMKECTPKLIWWHVPEFVIHWT